ncbi:D-2-hydroxyacid dehydrogenase family protein [Hylemonella gracilis]|uniref:D-isomer specific 2-hydroxyacid dehydrogenase n=1 Tax=Hylemonella gracilis ATCC 19624 TaxID=887062 RepID=F3KY26_9BURK|nr:D-2-hydroxyacid dehydrogenase family protein [Hylemonella gracilis]EGI75316.1 D-isomer specific 2-hydroxyacid dehydrogenase [Hylemonella gracilis ATCC 19624]
MNTVILDDYQDVVRHLQCADKLAGLPWKVYNNTVKGLGQLAIRLRDAEALVLIRERTAINRALLDKLPKLKFISQTGRMGSHIDLAACTERGIAVAEGSGSPIAPAELTWALVMAATRRLPHYIGNLKQGIWQRTGFDKAVGATEAQTGWPPAFGLGVALRGRTLGLWGYGKIGQMVAGYGRAFGMRVLVWGSEASRQQAVLDGLEAAASREDFFSASDVLSLHLRLNEATRGLVTAQDLARMQPTAVLVNTSRAELIEPDALPHALRQGRPGLAAIDVFESEPIASDHPLLGLGNCICTPHIGYVERDNYEQYFGAAFDNLLNYLKGQPSHVVNPEALAR